MKCCESVRELYSLILALDEVPLKDNSLLGKNSIHLAVLTLPHTSVKIGHFSTCIGLIFEYFLSWKNSEKCQQTVVLKSKCRPFFNFYFVLIFFIENIARNFILFLTYYQATILQRTTNTYKLMLALKH